MGQEKGFLVVAVNQKGREARSVQDILTIPVKCLDSEVVAACSIVAEENPDLQIIGVLSRELLDAMLSKLNDFERGV